MNFLKKSKNLIDNMPEKVRGFLIKERNKERNINDTIVPLEQGQTRSIQASDRATLDLLSEVERFIKDREVLQLTNIEMKEQIEHLERRVQLLTMEKDKYIYQFLDKEEEIKGIEGTLTKKHLLYDQLVEEYKKLQAITSSEINELKSEIEVEQHKYNQLVQEFKDFRAGITKENDALQEKVRRLEAKNDDLKEQFQAKVDENAVLLEKINQFSEQFTFTALSKKQKTKTSSPSKSSQAKEDSNAAVSE